MLRKALELDPFSLDANWFIGWVYLSLRRLDEGEEVAHRILGPGSFSCPSEEAGIIEPEAHAENEQWHSVESAPEMRMAQLKARGCG
jgi:hypothetical protein